MVFMSACYLKIIFIFGMNAKLSVIKGNKMLSTINVNLPHLWLQPNNRCQNRILKKFFTRKATQ